MSGIKLIFSIKDLENITGIKAHTIRIWEKRYNLLTPKRTDTNIRFYDNDSLKKLLNIVLLNKNNYKISKIAEMTSEEIMLNARELANINLIDDEAINAFKLAMFQFDKVLFHKTYNELAQKKTFRDIFKDIFTPFLHQIGLLWHTETLLTSHEHFISNLITQKIQINTEKLELNVSNRATTYVLFLPENEMHEVGLLYLNYELVLRGYQTIYLGPSLPLNNLDYFFKNNKDLCFITSMTIEPHDNKLMEYFNKIDAILKHSEHEFIAFGRKTEALINHKFDSNIRLYATISEFLKNL